MLVAHLSISVGCRIKRGERQIAFHFLSETISITQMLVTIYIMPEREEEN
jgi:hypothetical protein